MEAPADLGSVEALLLGSWMAIFSLCPHMAEGTRELSGVSIRTLILSSAKGPPPNTITLVSILACKIERTQYSVYRRVVWFCFCYVLTFSMVNILLEGILEINIIQIADVLSPELQPDNSLMDFTVTCEGTIPTEVCTIISDPTCQLAQDMVCNSVDMDDTCLVTVRRAFKGSGMYCVNFTLGDNASLALTSTLVSIAGNEPASPFRISAALISGGCLAIIVTVITILVYKKHKEYKPIKSSTEKVVKSKGLQVILNYTKAVFFPGNQEKNPLLKDHARIL